jgi:hypothetical protein
MLIARPAKRDRATFFKVDARFDLVVDEVVVGGLVYQIRTETAEISWRTAEYRAGRARPRQDDTPLARAIRRVKGQTNPGPNPILLTDADGGIRAQAEERRGVTWIEAAGQTFELRRRSAFSRRFDLYPEATREPVGSVGQTSALSTSITSDCLPEVGELIQAFLIALLIDTTFVALDRSSS